MVTQLLGAGEKDSQVLTPEKLTMFSGKTASTSGSVLVKYKLVLKGQKVRGKIEHETGWVEKWAGYEGCWDREIRSKHFDSKSSTKVSKLITENIKYPHFKCTNGICISKIT